MKVVQINAVCGTGSTGRICTDLADTLIAGGHECKILYGNGSSHYPHGINVSNKWLVKLNALRARITGNDMGGCFISTWRIIRFLNKYEPDVVHLHNVHANFVNFSILCKYLVKKKIQTVITMHDCWYFTGKCTHYTSFNCQKWQNGCGNCPHLHAGIPSWFRDKTAYLNKKKHELLLRLHNLHLVGCSHWIASEAKKSLSGCQYSVIHNGIDATKFFPEPSNFKEKYHCQECELILGFANKWLQQRNTMLFNDVINKLNKHQKLVLVGCSQDQIKYLIDKSHKVIAIPYTKSEKELREIYSACTIFVNISHEDTLPTVCLEAQACGLPVLGLHNTGIPETISRQYGKTLEHITTEDIFSFLNYIQNKNKLIVSDSLRIFICNNFNKSIAYQKYLSIYNFT